MYRVEKITHNEVALVSEMENEIFSFPWAYESFETLIENPCNHFYIVYDGDIPVAYFGIMIIINECDIYNIAVRPNYQGKGIGSFIMQEIIEICKDNEVDTITLEVREFNYKAIGLYEKYGFKLITRIKGYYSKPSEDGLLMRLIIDEEKLKNFSNRNVM